MRGTQMVAAMKIISLCFDIDRSNDQMIKPNVFEFWGYILSPANVTMGPWCSYGEYKQVYQKLRWVGSTIALHTMLSHIISSNNKKCMLFFFYCSRWKAREATSSITACIVRIFSPKTHVYC